MDERSRFPNLPIESVGGRRCIWLNTLEKRELKRDQRSIMDLSGFIRLTCALAETKAKKTM